jgi:shikimate dehydrogenase
MHNAAYAALGLDWVYVAMPVPPERLGDAVRGLAALGLAGLNVTIPHKQNVAATCDELSPQARTAGSVNTITVRDDGSLYGDTTDGAGMLDAIGQLPGSALVLGAGGAARAAVAALLDAGVDVAVSARRDAEARSVAEQFGCSMRPWPPEAGAALIVNATPVGQADPAGELPVDQAALAPADVVCDLVYRGDGVETALISSARRLGKRAVDGLDVLIGQGARSFRLFTGVEPPLDAMSTAARDVGPSKIN